MKAVLSFVITHIVSLFRMGFVGVLSTLFVIYNVDHFTHPSYGTHNLVIIVGSFVFVPIFSVVFVESFYFFKRRMHKQQSKKKLPNLDL